MPIFISLMTDPTTRELIADLLAALKSWSPTGGGPLEGAEEQYEAALIAKAEAFLAQPEPTLTVEDCSNMHKHWFNFLGEDRPGEITLDGFFSREDLIEIANTVPPTKA